MHGEPVKVGPPSVPAGDDRADQVATILGDEKCFWVSSQQRRNSSAGVSGPAGVLRGVAPKLEDGTDILVTGWMNPQSIA